MLGLAGRRLEGAVEGAGEVLPEEVGRARLERLAVLHERLDAVRVHGPREALGRRLDALQDRHRHPVLGEAGVDVEHRPRLLDGFGLGRVGGVALLPEELGRAQEEPRAHLPADDVGPLVELDREVAVGLDPAGVRVPDDRLGRRADDERLLELGVGVDDELARVVRLEAVVRHDGALLREAVDVGRLAGEEALRDEEREVGVAVARRAEHRVEGGPHVLPQFVAVGRQDHRAPHGRRLGKARGPDDVLVPLSEVVLAGRDLVGHRVGRAGATRARVGGWKREARAGALPRPG